MRCDVDFTSLVINQTSNIVDRYFISIHRFIDHEIGRNFICKYCREIFEFLKYMNFKRF